MSTQTITVELPAGAYRLLRTMVESGEYADESQAISEALLTLSLEPSPEPLEPGAPAYETWLREEAIPAHDEMMANPGDVYTGEEVLAFLQEQREARATAHPALRKAG